MAIMYPSALPQTFVKKDRGEGKLFQLLKEQLSNDWIVYHSVYWHGKPSPGSKRRDGETDFICTHPKHGILIIEVKGGVFITFDPVTSLWTSTDNDLQMHDITNPFHQARSNKYALIQAITQLPGWHDFDDEQISRNINIGYCVVFTDVNRIQGTLPFEAKKEFTLFDYHCQQLNKHLVNILDYFCEDKPFSMKLTQKIHQDLQKAYAPSFVLDRKLSHWISDEEKIVFELTEEQYRFLDLIRYIPRASIFGCAGCGKTLLATRKAEIAASQNLRTLLVCYNQILGEHFRKFASDKENLTAGNFHPFISDQLKGSLAESILYDDVALREAVFSNEIELFDCILIDEAQDFSAIQLEILLFLLKENGMIYYFWDANQKIIQTDLHIPKDIPPFVLDTNLRNTKYIFDAVKPHYYQGISLNHRGPLGRKVSVTDPVDHQNKAELFSRLRTEINKLLVNDGCKPKDITIITMKSVSKSLLRDFAMENVKFTCFENECAENSIRIDTNRRFKGMESSIVIACELDDERSMANEELWHDMCYVSFSRAKNHLVIIPTDNTIDRFLPQ
ncbi:MAG: hypothetical protein CVU96_04270 [Firmicutes bacterium HGW-Firmicutes-20]|jgi:hypothetical protein|nr:MAG: hypothetical protein CVU96_04270 [Firmicutes bacterium HGW-Firmicutes-20]PKM67586.1 MAG: hypothetical protein CVU94_06435 [Firmicutes bacterium HGW-Firmicutes-19]